MCLSLLSSKRENVAQLSSSLLPHGLQSSRLLCPWNFPGKNTGVGSLSLLQKIFPTQGSNSDLLHFIWIVYCLNYQRNANLNENHVVLGTDQRGHDKNVQKENYRRGCGQKRNPGKLFGALEIGNTHYENTMEFP